MKQCRTCLTELSHLNRLNQMNTQISEMITQITSLLVNTNNYNYTLSFPITDYYYYCYYQITPDDGLTQWICNKCLKEIKRAYKFRRKCLESAKILQQTKLDTFPEYIDVKTETDKADVDIKIEPEISETEDFDDEDDWKPIKNDPETTNQLKEYVNINLDSKENHQKSV